MNLLSELKHRFTPALSELANPQDLPALLAMIRPAQDAKFGDYQANCAMPLGKRVGQPPRELANQLIETVTLDDLAEKVEVAGPGFINITISDQILNQELTQAFADLQRLGIEASPLPKKIIIDFSSPNVAKPLHVGHIRSTAIGDSLSRVLRFLGHDVITDNHLGDWGTQFGMILYGYKNFSDAQAYAENPIAELSSIYRTVRHLIDYHNSVAKLPDAKALLEKQEQLFAEFSATDPGEDKALAKKLKKDTKSIKSKIAAQKEMIQSLVQTIETVESDPATHDLANRHPQIAQNVLAETAQLHAGDIENKELWSDFMEHGMQEIQRVYDRLDIKFDFVLGESFYHEQLSTVVDELISKEMATESEGALCVFLENHKAPMIIRKSDGAFLYATTDLATIKYRMSEWKPDVILYVVDFRQGEHFEKLFDVARLWGYTDTEYQHVKFGTVMGDDGKPFKTRAGDTVGLEPLLDEAENRALALVTQLDEGKPGGPEFDEEQRKAIAQMVGISALKYADLSQNRTSDYTFSYDKMVELKGNTATYLQYGYARVNGIFRKGEVDIDDLRENAVPFEFTEDIERELALKLLRFEEALQDVISDYRPNLLANYLFELTQTFFVFFEKCPVLKTAGSLRQSRLQFCDLTARTLQKGLSLLGIGVLQKM
ncbi:MAG: arginine--tRNA ligase [Planctomycetaceae bacterium]|nr:arginine--tRNA ligase [Planctomycetaceae bacterium]